MKSHGIVGMSRDNVAEPRRANDRDYREKGLPGSIFSPLIVLTVHMVRIHYDSIRFRTLSYLLACILPGICKTSKKNNT